MNPHGPTAAHSPLHQPIGMTSFFGFGSGLFGNTQERTRNASPARPAFKSNTTTNIGNNTSPSSGIPLNKPPKDASTPVDLGASSDKNGRITMEDRLAMVNQILKKDDLYQILGLERTCPQSDIRRSYITKSRIIHPDKMRNSEASTRAFQKLSSAYETLSDPARRRDYNINGRRYHSHNSEETLSNALSQIFSEFMAGDFENLLQIIEFLNSQNPELAINREKAKLFFNQIRGIAVAASQYVNVAKFEIMRLFEIQQELRSLSYFDVLGRLRLTIQMTRVFLSIPVKMNTHVTDRQIMNEQLTNVLGGVAGFLENSENNILDLNVWMKRRSWFL